MKWSKKSVTVKVRHPDGAVEEGRRTLNVHPAGKVIDTSVTLPDGSILESPMLLRLPCPACGIYMVPLADDVWRCPKCYRREVRRPKPQDEA